MASIKIIGTMKGVQLKSKVESTDGRTSHDVTLKIEITDGVQRIQDIVELLKQICSINIESKQPTLMGKN